MSSGKTERKRANSRSFKSSPSFINLASLIPLATLRTFPISG
jgi:hypothetical protein